jgi:hypothetical protein
MSIPKDRKKDPLWTWGRRNVKHEAIRCRSAVGLLQKANLRGREWGFARGLHTGKRGRKNDEVRHELLKR